MTCVTALKEEGLKLTPQRRLILDIIHDSGGHVTAEEILGYVHTKMPRVHKSTIYRTMELLEKLRCVIKSELGDKFIYHHAEEGHHHHLVCPTCGKSMDCDEGVFLPVERALEKNYGFHVHFKHVVMSGLCSDCRARS